MNNSLQKLINQIIPHKKIQQTESLSYAPANIALIKYWGKRCATYNLPITPSLSISLGDKGCETTISLSSNQQDDIFLNNQLLLNNNSFAKRLIQFLDLFRPENTFFTVKTNSTVPVASGLASSACGFAAIVKCLNQLFAWNLSEQYLSVLARIGSGSACRSLWHGFVQWQKGEEEQGLDSFAYPLDYDWLELRIGILLNDSGPKKISSREGMIHTQKTSPFYKNWPQVVSDDLTQVKAALKNHDFELLAKTAEANATAMHALMLSARPSVVYSNDKTYACMQAVWQARADGIQVYFTQDAGPHIKLLFQAEDLENLQILFPDMLIVKPFAKLL